MRQDPATEREEPQEEAESLSVREFLGIVRLLAPLTRPYRGLLLAIAVFVALEGAFNAVFSLCLKFLIDDGLLDEAGPNGGVVIVVLATLALAGITVSLAGLMCDYLAARAVGLLIRDVRERLFAHVQQLSMRFHTRASAGKVLSRFSGDVLSLEAALTSLIPWCLLPLVEVVFSVVFLFFFNVWMTLIALLFFPLSFFGPQLFARKSLVAAHDKKVLEAAALGTAQEHLLAHAAVRAYGLEPWSRGVFNGVNARLSRTLNRYSFLSALVERSAGVSTILLHLAIVGVGAYLAFHKLLSIGSLVAFESIFLSLCYAVTYVTQYVPTLAQASGATAHLEELLAEKPEVVDAPDAVALPPLREAIELRDVTFSYSGQSNQLEGVSVRVPRGAFVAFVGGSGSGKTTLLSLLLRFHDPTAGSVCVDGHDLRTVTQESLRAQVGIVMQETLLLNLSIRENIRLGNLSATDEQVEAAACAAELLDFIKGLPNGYDTVIGERGGQVSGGQKQRLALARALVRDPAILILDEATAALDYTTERAIHRTLLQPRRKRTVIAVTHRLGTVVDADMIHVLNHGRIVESGTHGQLIAAGGAYSRLWDSQMVPDLGEDQEP